MRKTFNCAYIYFLFTLKLCPNLILGFNLSIFHKSEKKEITEKGFENSFRFAYLMVHSPWLKSIGSDMDIGIDDTVPACTRGL